MKNKIRRNPAIAKHPTSEIVAEARRRGLVVRVNPIKSAKDALIVTGKPDIARVRKALRDAKALVRVKSALGGRKRKAKKA